MNGKLLVYYIILLFNRKRVVSCSSVGIAPAIASRRILFRDKIWEGNLSAFFNNDLAPVHSAVNEYIVGVLINDGMM